MKKKATTIGKMTQSRRVWAFNPSPKVRHGKKGRMQYQRQNNKFKGDTEL